MLMYGTVCGSLIWMHHSFRKEQALDAKPKPCWFFFLGALSAFLPRRFCRCLVALAVRLPFVGVMFVVLDGITFRNTP